jgi:hypothetical protein
MVEFFFEVALRVWHDLGLRTMSQRAPSLAKLPPVISVPHT